MKAVDTNILVRFLTGDDPVAFQRVAETLKSAHEREEPFRVTTPVLLELLWVLKESYALTRNDILDAVAKLLRLPVFAFESDSILGSILGNSGEAILGTAILGTQYSIEYCVPRIARDSDENHVASFDDQGNLVIEGELDAGASAGDLNAWSSNNAGDFVIRDASETVVARFEDNGDVYIKGSFSKEQTNPTPSGDNAFIIKLGSATVALVDTDGNLKLKGRLFQGGNPDPGA